MESLRIFNHIARISLPHGLYITGAARDLVRYCKEKLLALHPFLLLIVSGTQSAPTTTARQPSSIDFYVAMHQNRQAAAQVSQAYIIQDLGPDLL